MQYSQPIQMYYKLSLYVVKYTYKYISYNKL